MATACLRDFTLAPLLLLSVPRFRRRIALATRFDAALPYFGDRPGFPVPAFFPVLLRERVRLAAAMRPSSECRTVRTFTAGVNSPDGRNSFLREDAYRFAAAARSTEELPAGRMSATS
jgi:hypothetical protein